MGELSGKVAIVTGASKGIGAAIARRFAEAGVAVAVNYASDKAGADRLVDEIVRKGGKAVAIQASVAKSAEECTDPPEHVLPSVADLTRLFESPGEEYASMHV